MVREEKKYTAGAALCPKCFSVIEHFFEKCPWCNHVFSGKEALKILSMLAETGVGSSDLLGEVHEAGRSVAISMLPFLKDNFEKGSQGAKAASLVIYQEFGDLSQLPIEVLEEGFKISSNQVKIEIIKTLTMAGTPEAANALKNLRDYENDPEVLQAFSMKIKAYREDDTPETLCEEEIEDHDAAATLDHYPEFPPPLPGNGAPVGKIPSAEEILPPLPMLLSPTETGEPSGTGTPKQSPSSRIRGLIVMGTAFVLTGAVVLFFLVMFDVKIPWGYRSIPGNGDREAKSGFHLNRTGSRGKDRATETAATFPAVSEPMGERPPPTEQGQKTASTMQPQAKRGTGLAAPARLDFVISASSVNKDFPPSNMIDGDRRTVWQEEKRARPLGHTITLDFGREVTVKRMSFLTGYDDPNGKRGDMFFLNNRLKRCELRFSDGSKRQLTFEDRRDKQSVAIEPPVKTKEIVITILEVFPGSWFYDNAIAEIEVEGY